MENFIINPIGKVAIRGGEALIELDKKYIPALRGLDGFGYVQVLWWFDRCDNPEARSVLAEERPYQKGPGILGTFATRSPMRPNPIALSCAAVTCLDMESGVIGLEYLDADHGSPVVDIKPYTPSLDRVENPSVPGWCAHWPKSREQSGSFDWAAEFNF